MTHTGSTSYFLTDHFSTTRSLADNAGNISANVAYSSFGNILSGSAPARYTYAGREIDDETALMYYRARWYEPKHGRFFSEDKVGLAGGINFYRYVLNNPENLKDPLGLYEIDVHYYLTYYLVIKTVCFTDLEAREIANGDQGVDEDPRTKPGLGSTARQRHFNAFYHALHPGSYQPYLDAHWTNATASRAGDLSKLGVYLHYLQDTYSHAGFDDPVCGHGCFDWHFPDKTDSDVDKAVRMAQSTWYALKKFASEKRKCTCKEWPDASWKEVYGFAQAPGGPDFREINPQELDYKRRILGVSPR